jgi:hypothetical protein
MTERKLKVASVKRYIKERATALYPMSVDYSGLTVTAITGPNMHLPWAPEIVRLKVFV